MHLRILLVLIVLGAVPAVPAPGAGATHVVEASNFVWTPGTIAIAPGDAVTFSSAEGSHAWESSDGSAGCTLPCTRTYPEEGTFAYRCSFHPSMTGVIVVGTPADVTFTEPGRHDILVGMVPVRGTASHSTSEIARVSIRVDEGEFADAVLDGEGTFVAWALPLDTLPLVNGPHVITARATTRSGFVSEATLDVYVGNAERHDLVVDSVTGTDGVASTSITFAIENRGNVVASGWRASVEYLEAGAWRTILDVDVGSLGAGETDSRTVTWDGGGLAVGEFQVRVVADALDHIEETDESNNEQATAVAFVTPLVSGVRIL